LARSEQQDPLTRVLATFRDPETTDFDNAWVGLEPTFQTRKSVRKWRKMSAREGGEDAYFESGYMLRTEQEVARAIKKSYQGALRNGGGPACLFDRVKLEADRDQWDVQRQNLNFFWADQDLEPFTVRFALDPETFEYGIKPVPLVWFYDERFVAFLQDFLWDVPQTKGLRPSIAHGGGQFSLSAKTFLTGSLLADDIAYKLNHPELATWVMDSPDCDDRSFRATARRLAAFRQVLEHYWAGGFHPRAIGALTVEDALFDRAMGPSLSPPAGLMDSRRGPSGSAREVFQTNFAFGRAVRLQAQNVHPGYWQSAHPTEEGYRPDQIMRYSEGNLNRLQIAGELHVKSGKVLQPERIPELDAPLELAQLTDECSWEDRAQMGRTSARDFVEALLLDVHHARYLQAHPHVTLKRSLLQDQLMSDGEETLRRHGGKKLDQLHAKARKLNLECSRDRIHSDWIEPETLFWAAWKVLPAGEKVAIAREVISGFVERVEQAATMDPRPSFKEDPMEWHRHRILPVLWQVLEEKPGRSKQNDPVARELEAWKAKRDEYLARRPIYSPIDLTPPWEVGGE
jgi:hypothetical protein